MSFGFYNLGTILLLAGVLYVGHLARVSQDWMIGIPALLLAAGIMGAVTQTRSRDPKLAAPN